jgi:hypothetical protein
MQTLQLKRTSSILLICLLAALVGGMLAPRLGLQTIPVIVTLVIAPWILARPERAFCAYLLSIPLSTALEATIGFGVTKLAFFGLVISWVPTLRRGRVRFRSDLLLWCAVFIIVCVASSLTSNDPVTALSNTARLAGYALFVLIATDLIVRRNVLRRGLIALLLPAIPFVLLGAYQFLTHSTILGLGLHSETGDFVVWKGYVQASAVFAHPNVFATYLLLYICLSLGIALFIPDQRKRALAVTIASISFAGLLLTFSRSGWVGFLAAALVFLVLYPRFLKIGILVFAVVPLLMVLLPQKEIAGLAKRTTPEMDASTRARLGAYKTAWAMFSDYPVLGVGLGSFNQRFLEYKVPEARFPKNYIRGSELGMEAHSTYLQFLAETGVIGILAFIGLNVSVMHRILVLLRRYKTGLMRGLSVGLAAAFAGLVVQNGLNSQEYIKAFWVGIALISGIGELSPEQSEPTTIEPASV